MNPYELNAWTLSAYLTLIGILFWYIASKSLGRQEGTGIKSLFNAKLLFQLLGLLYIALAHLSVYGAVLMSIEHAGDPTCEMLLNTTTLNSTSNVTTHAYYNSCSTITTPQIQLTWFNILTWIFWAEIFMITIAAMFMFFKGVTRW